MDGMSKPFHLEAVERQDLPRVSTVMNKQSMEHFLWVHIPACMAQEFIVYEVREIEPDNGELILQGVMEQDLGKPWLRFVSESLNTTSGYHIYQVRFVHRESTDTASLYFAYHIQDSNPPKDYVYMKREGRA